MNNIKKKSTSGYILIKIGMQWLQEHRLVAEEILKRQLEKSEVIHHINFIKTENNPENLALFGSEKEHSHWHRQFNQFGWTNPLIREILNRKITNL